MVGVPKVRPALSATSKIFIIFTFVKFDWKNTCGTCLYYSANGCVPQELCEAYSRANQTLPTLAAGSKKTVSEHPQMLAFYASISYVVS